METLEIIGFKRANLGKAEAKRLREQGNVPSVIYGNDEQVHCYIPAILFRELVYTPEVHFVNLDVEGKEYRCILQDIQFHPVSDNILHADFLILDDKKPIKMDVPVHFVGQAPGIQQGGKLIRKNRLLKVKALPPHMPAHINVPIDTLDLGKSIKVGELEVGEFEFLTSDRVTIASVQVPRALKAVTAEGEEGEEGEEIEGEEGAEGAAEGEEGGAEEKKEEGGE
ncbi:MAG: 50S ribosomal protein L25/general stress protein Ctc [Cyclobacteriaceae bacterium]